MFTTAETLGLAEWIMMTPVLYFPIFPEDKFKTSVKNNDFIVWKRF